MIEKTNLAPLCMHLLDRLHRVQMVNSGIEPYFIQHHDPSVPCFLIQSMHGRGDVRRCDDMSLALDGGLDHCYMVGEWDEGDDEVMFSDGILEGRSRSYI